jgi:hypothetical protein
LREMLLTKPTDKEDEKKPKEKAEA